MNLLSLLGVGVLAVLLTASASAQTAPKFEIGGYVRAYGGMNLEDHPELDKNGKAIGGKWEPSMARGTISIRGAVEFDWVRFVAEGRIDREITTSYLETLEDAGISRGGSPFVNEEYDYDDFRELSASFDVGRVAVKLGKQQVVWGETDVLRGTDIIHGYDTRWRSILENENEELRKPLWLANVAVNLSEIDSSLQLIFRPGWDDEDMVGNDADVFGGRWAGQPAKGIDSRPSAPFNYHHPRGDSDDPHYGARWSGIVRQINYSLLYYHGQNLDPVANSIFNPYGAPPQSPSGVELIFPEVDTYGLTFNAFAEPIDTVIRGEFAFTPGKPYNVAGLTTGSPLLPPGVPVAAAVGVAGFAGIKEKDTLTSMVGFDKNLYSFGKLLGSARPVFWTSQVFDTWLTDHDPDKDDVVDLFGYGALKPEHWTVLTSVFSTSYLNDRVSPNFGIVYDISNRDLLLITGIDLTFGDHWRVHGEVLTIVPDGERTPFEDPLEKETRLFGTFANNNQLFLRVSYYWGKK